MPSGTVPFLDGFPGSELPGNHHLVPLGQRTTLTPVRQNRRHQSTEDEDDDENEDDPPDYSGKVRIRIWTKNTRIIMTRGYTAA